MNKIKIINTCPVCKKIIKDDESYYQCEDCKEYFHSDCAETDSESWNICPNCQKNNAEYLCLLLKQAERLITANDCDKCILKDVNCRPYECDIIGLKNKIKRLKL